MPYLVTCPSCGIKLKSVQPVPAGRSLNCPKCATAFALSEPAPEVDVSTVPIPSAAPIAKAIRPLASKRGQVWTFRLDPTEPPATLTILRVESLPKLGEVVHISVSAIRMPTGITSVGHLPMSKAALDRSVIALQRTEMGIPNLVGYEAWKSAKGGVFTTSVNEALAFVREAMQRGK